MLRAIFQGINRSFPRLLDARTRPCPINTDQAVRFLDYRPIESANKITVGHKMTQVVEKKRQKYLIKKAAEEKFSPFKNRANSRLLIAAYQPQFNHYTGQLYRDLSERNFASYGWLNRRSAGQYFTINPIGTHPSLIDSSKNRTNDDHIIEFSSLNLNDCMFNQRPTYIQFQSLNEILKHDSHVLVIAETGGGKTLCYAVPILENAVRVRHQIEKRLGLKRQKNQPIGLVLVPTRELAFQVYNAFKKLIESSPLETVAEENATYLELLNNLNVVVDLHPGQIKAREAVSGQHIESFETTTRPVDIMITMPGQLEDRLFHKDLSIDTTYLKTVAVDEADTLFDDSFSKTTLKCLTKLQLNLSLPKAAQIQKPSELANPYESPTEYNHEVEKMNFYIELDQNLKDPSTQLVFTSATIPKDLKTMLEESFDWQTQLKTIKTGKVNRLMLHMPQKFIRTHGAKRPAQLLELVNKELSKNDKNTMMIFCYRTITATFVSKFLKENGIESVDLLTKKLNNSQRERVVSDFFNGKTRVLVCTDIASRGWNTIQVSHVVNFEMPMFIADYLHRVGRVGRLGGAANGLVTNYIVKNSDVQLVWNIERSIRSGSELKDVDANVKRLYGLHAAELSERVDRMRDLRSEPPPKKGFRAEEQEEETDIQEEEYSDVEQTKHQTKRRARVIT